MNPSFNKPPTLCWDCRNAIGGCSWSTLFKPVEGWKAEPTKNKEGATSFNVIKCPEFKRDAIYGGQQRWKE